MEAQGLTARRPIECAGCNAVIGRGEVYTVDSGGIILCPDCYEGVNDVDEEDDPECE
ncbi:MAG: hypothetical protein AABZ12_00260 [Planctomycetota bacterium]